MIKRSRSTWALILLALASSAATTASAADPEALRQKLEKIKADREKARAAARAAASQQPAATATPTTTPPTTATALPTATATASATPKASATPSATPPTASASAAPAASSAAKAPVLPEIEQLRKTRPDRKHREAQNLRERWGELVTKDSAKAELRQHAQRLAYLQRIRQLAETKNDLKLVESVDKLITEEERRDADAMNALRTSAASTGAKP